MLGELATTILLVVEVKFFQELVAPFLQATLAPVLIPEGGALDSLLCQMTSPIDLFETLPTTGSKGCREVLQSKFFRLPGSLRQTECKALLTPSAPFRFTLKATHILSPLVMIIIAINPSETETLCMAFTLVLADLIFLTGKDIGIIIEYCWANPIGEHPLHNRR